MRAPVSPSPPDTKYTEPPCRARQRPRPARSPRQFRSLPESLERLCQIGPLALDRVLRLRSRSKLLGRDLLAVGNTEFPMQGVLVPGGAGDPVLSHDQ